MQGQSSIGGRRAASRGMLVSPRLLNHDELAALNCGALLQQA
jgi:hypothetical protein